MHARNLYMSDHNYSIEAVILAAGKSTRFKLPTPKLLTNFCGIPMILYTTRTAQTLNLPITLVVGHEASSVIDTVRITHPSAQFVHQYEQRGTGHALLQTMPTWHAEHILIINGDCPLLQTATLKHLIDTHLADNAAISFVTAHHSNVHNSYGRVVKNGNHIKIIEKKDLREDPALYPVVNAGIYIMKKDFLQTYISMLNTNNAAQEYYITDLVEIAQNHDLSVSTIVAPFDEVAGINTVEEFMSAQQIHNERTMRTTPTHGVSLP